MVMEHWLTTSHFSFLSVCLFSSKKKKGIKKGLFKTKKNNRLPFPFLFLFFLFCWLFFPQNREKKSPQILEKEIKQTSWRKLQHFPLFFFFWPCMCVFLFSRLYKRISTIAFNQWIPLRCVPCQRNSVFPLLNKKRRNTTKKKRSLRIHCPSFSLFL